MPATSNLTIKPTGTKLGADIEGVDLSQPIDSATAEAILNAWHDHIVIRIRGQKLTDAQLVEFAKIFGKLDLAPMTTTGRPWLDGFPELNVISNVKVGGEAIGGLGYGEAIWHTDMSYKPEPPSASILYGIEIPVGQGHTWFSNMYAAYDALPGDLRTAIAGKSIKHDSSRNSAGFLRAGHKEVTDPREAPGEVHPIVRTHPKTGRKALFLGRRKDAYVVGLSLEDSESLLDRLFEHAVQPEYTWAQEWQVGDLIVWDNRCAMHRRDSFDPESRRLLHRAQTAGDKPF
ncbi:MAG: TauD/TfdA family dioxygenase [Candidatus Eremiobacteraeota bacterium]|nr:TauD/TfdA family dioxygenase [Candidatus Eremiobacteraeota bacterium]